MRAKIQKYLQLSKNLIDKKSIIITILLLSVAATVNAQDDEKDTREKLVFGVKAGLNRSNVWDAKGEEFRADAKFGFAGGVFLGIPIGKYLGIQPEILISQKGFEGNGKLLGNNYSFSKTTTFIDVPLQVQLKPIEYLTIVAGPQYSYLIHEKNTYNYGVNSVDQEKEFENDNVRKNIMSFVIGADVNISHVVISGRVAWDFLTNNGDGNSSTPRYKNQWAQLTLGYKF